MYPGPTPEDGGTGIYKVIINIFDPPLPLHIFQAHLPIPVLSISESVILPIMLLFSGMLCLCVDRKLIGDH